MHDDRHRRCLRRRRFHVFGRPVCVCSFYVSVYANKRGMTYVCRVKDISLVLYVHKPNR